MKKYRITYTSNDNVVDVNPNIDPEEYHSYEYVTGKITTKFKEVVAFSADDAELQFYKSFGSTLNNLIKILDVYEIPLNENDMSTYRVCIDYIFDDSERTGHGEVLVSAVSPRQAELFAFRSLCSTDKCGLHAYVVRKL
jgi:hypothetical protein